MRKKINLYVDDCRDVPENFTIARTVKEAIYYLENFDVEVLSLDHDLGEDEKGNLLPTGYDLVKYICQNGLRADKIYIHTSNPVGKDNIFYTLKGAQYRNFIDKDIKIYPYPLIPNKYSEK